MFKPPDQKSREALDTKRLRIGSHELNIQNVLKDPALKISSLLVKPFLELGTSLLSMLVNFLFLKEIRYIIIFIN